LLIGAVLLASWLAMQDVHEFGHVVGAWLTGAQVTRVVIHPLTISRTDLSHNPKPLLVVWAGPVLGCLLPLIAWGIAAGLRWSWTYLLRFFAGFCLIANGAYIAVGSFERIGDAGVMLRNGSAPWWLWAFGVVTVPAGLWLWHRQGPHFGLGRGAGEVSTGAAYGCLAILLALIALGLAVDGQ
jgi:Peptidase M50B-like